VGILNNLVDKVSDLVKVKIDQAKLDLQGKAAFIISKVIAFLVIYLFAASTYLFLMMGLAFLINDWLNSSFLGFILIGAFSFVLTICVLLASKTGWFPQALEESILKEEEKLQDQ